MYLVKENGHEYNRHTYNILKAFFTITFYYIPFITTLISQSVYLS